MMDDRIAVMSNIAELYKNLDDIHKGMLLGWAAALKMMAQISGNDDGAASA